MLDLVKTRNSGKTVTDDFEYTTRGRKVVAITLVNQGINSNVVIEFGNGSITLSAKESIKFGWTYPYIDDSIYNIVISSAGGAGAVIKKLELIETSIVETSIV